MMERIKKEEKLVLITTCLVGVVMISTGLYFKTLKPSEPYKSNIKELNEISIKENIQVNVFDEISKNPADYMEANPSILKNIQLDMSKVDNKKLGTYKILAIYQKNEFEISVKVVDKEAPILKTKHNNFTWTLEKNETVNDIMKYVGLSAEDNYDGVMKEINWLKELPQNAGKETYPIKVKDKSGNTSEIDIVITYEFPSNEENTEISNNEE